MIKTKYVTISNCLGRSEIYLFDDCLLQRSSFIWFFFHEITAITNINIMILQLWEWRTFFFKKIIWDNFLELNPPLNANNSFIISPSSSLGQICISLWQLVPANFAIPTIKVSPGCRSWRFRGEDRFCPRKSHFNVLSCVVWILQSHLCIFYIFLHWEMLDSSSIGFSDPRITSSGLRDPLSEIMSSPGSTSIPIIRTILGWLFFSPCFRVWAGNLGKGVDFWEIQRKAWGFVPQGIFLTPVIIWP